MAGTGVDQAAGELAAKGVVQACLVAADARIDFIAAASGGLVDEFGISEERTRHGHHVGVAIGQNLLGDLRGVDAVGGDQRHVDRTTQLGGHLAESATRHFGGDRGNACFVPANAGVNQCRTGLLDRLGQLHDLGPDTALGNQIKHRQAINNDEIRAHGFAHPAHDFDRQTHAVFVAATPAVGAMVGVRGEELVDEVAFRTHDFNTVIAGTLSQPGAGHEVADLLLDALFIQFLGRERVDRRLDCARRYLAGAVGITPGMEDLQADLASRIVDRPGNHQMLFCFFSGTQLGRATVHTALIVGRNAPRDHQAHTAFGTLGKIGRHALKATGLFFKAGVHGAHQAAIAQGGKAQIQGGH